MSATVPPTAVRLHRRQFVVGPEARGARDGWISRQVAPAVWVSRCPELRSGWATDADGAAWCLLGLAVQTIDDRPDPLDEISRTATARVPELYASWAGRWVLVGPDSVHMDASGLLGCYFTRDAEGRGWLSSSPALLSAILGERGHDSAHRQDPRRLKYVTGISWFPPPRSRFDAIGRLLPSQVLQLPCGQVRPRPLLPAIDPSLDYDEALDRLLRALVTAVRRLPLEGKPLWMSLSAGADSRLVFVAAHLAGVRMTCYTRIAARMSLADRLLPPKLAATLGHEHVFFRSGRGARPAGRLELVMDHCAGHVSDGDALPMLQGVRDSLEGISLGGQAFGVGKVLGRNLPARIDDPARAAIDIAGVLGEPADSTATAAIREWLEWVAATPHEHLDWRDRFYIEQRLAGWQSAKEQVYDLAKVERFPVINAARSYALLLGLPESRRRGVRHQVEMINRAAPALAQFPINPPDRSFGLLKAIAIKTCEDPLYVGRKLVGEWRARRTAPGAPHAH